MDYRLIRRPIAVTMFTISIVVLGCLAVRYIPVSLMPDIDIPQITVQASCPGYSAREVEQRMTTMLRGQLMQVDGVKDIRSESRTDAGTVTMTFEPGSNTDLHFIEVNEKIDRAMSSMPHDTQRPKVMKAGVMDIPAFYLDIWLNDSTSSSSTRFAQFGRFVRSVVSKRIEQLPQTVMVDMSGTVNTEIVCTPNKERMDALGITTADIEAAILRNNITLEALSVVDGIYRYHIHFDSQLLTRDDIASIYLRHDGRLLQLRDICNIDEHMAEPNGIVRHNGRRAVTLAVIKQDDAQMDDLRDGMERVLTDLKAEHPEICFEITRDQTRLLSYTIDNLKGNLYAGALLACLVLLLFMREWRLSLLIVCSIPLSLILTLLCFYVIGITLNIVSLSGLILGTGMIVDNSIIVIDNIVRRWREGESLVEATVKGTREVFTPMLSSVLTTCSVFVPLIFISGTAGALFYDQAMGVSISLLASLAVAVIATPVYLHLLYRRRCVDKDASATATRRRLNMTPLYHIVMKWVLRHARTCIVLVLCALPITAAIFWHIEKERMPQVPEDDMLVTIDWNVGISAKENDRRVTQLIAAVGSDAFSSTSMSGTQEFLLSHTKDITSSEAIVYIKLQSAERATMLRSRLTAELHKRWPQASAEFSEVGNIYSMMFATDEADLDIHLQDNDGRRPDIAAARSFTDTLRANFSNIAVMPVVTETNVRYIANMEQMAIHNVSYESLHRRLKELISRGHMFEINDGAQSVPVLVGASSSDNNRIMGESVTNADGTPIPISLLVSETRGEEYKRLQASAGGEYYSVCIKAPDSDVERVMDFTNEFVHRHGSSLTATFAGSYFSSRQLIGELSLVLLVALVLLYFILAAQFESFIQPFIILTEMVVNVFFVVLVLWLLGMTINVMSMIGLVVMSGIVINDSILKIDTINRLRNDGYSLLRAIITAGHHRLNAIVMTSLTTILALVPFLRHADLGSALQYPLSVTLITGMTIGTLVSLFFIPLLYFLIYRNHKK